MNTHQKSRVARPWPNGTKLAGVVLLGSFLAVGRYDWNGAAAANWRPYVLSWFFFVLVVTGLYATFSALGLPRTRGFWRVTAGASALLNLPYRWLRLDRWYFLSSHPQYYDRPKLFMPEWLGAGRLTHPQWNSTDWLFFGLLLAGTAVAVVLLRPRLASAAPASERRGRTALFASLYLLLTLQTWMHVSNRSPYSYEPTFERPLVERYAYTVSLLPDNRAQVNADVLYFTRLEELFLGTRTDTPTMLVRRISPFYFSAHLSFFVGVYHAYLVINLLLWLAAVMSMHYFCEALTGSSLAAGCAAFLVGCGPGFIMYVAQPMSYFAGYAVIAILLALYHRILVSSALRTPAALYASGVIFGLALLTTDTFAWALFLFLFPLVLRIPPWRSIAPILLGIALYALFLFMIFRVFGLERDPTNDVSITNSMQNIRALLREPNSVKLITTTAGMIGAYSTQMMQAFFYVPVALAVAGLFLLPAAATVRATALLLLVPPWVGFAFLYFGQNYLSTESRFNFAAYSGVILLAASFLSAVAGYFNSRNHPWLARLSVALPLVICVVLSNLDAFGSMQHLYYHFYWSVRPDNG